MVERRAWLCVKHPPNDTKFNIGRETVSEDGRVLQTYFSPNPRLGHLPYAHPYGFVLIEFQGLKQPRTNKKKRKSHMTITINYGDRESTSYWRQATSMDRIFELAAFLIAPAGPMPDPLPEITQYLHECLKTITRPMIYKIWTKWLQPWILEQRAGCHSALHLAYSHIARFPIPVLFPIIVDFLLPQDLSFPQE